MRLVKYNRPTASGNKMVNAFFDDFFTRDTEQLFVPPVDILENEQAYQLQLFLPDLTKEEVKIELDEGVLTVSGERKREEKQEGVVYHRVESFYGTFSRSFQLPDTVMLDEIEGHFENGVLKLILPKSEKKQGKRKIEIR